MIRICRLISKNRRIKRILLLVKKTWFQISFCDSTLCILNEIIDEKVMSLQKGFWENLETMIKVSRHEYTSNFRRTLIFFTVKSPPKICQTIFGTRFSHSMNIIREKFYCTLLQNFLLYIRNFSRPIALFPVNLLRLIIFALSISKH